MLKTLSMSMMLIGAQEAWLAGSGDTIAVQMPGGRVLEIRILPESREGVNKETLVEIVEEGMGLCNSLDLGTLKSADMLVANGQYIAISADCTQGPVIRDGEIIVEKLEKKGA